MIFKPQTPYETNKSKYTMIGFEYVKVKETQNMDFTNTSNDELVTMLNDIYREIKWAENYGKPIKKLTQKAETIKTEILKRMR